MIKIINASLEDAAIILALQKLAYQSEARLYNNFNIAPLTQTLEELKEEIADKVFLKTQIENEIVGSVRAFQDGNTCHIQRLLVHPDFQRQGIATALMAEIESRFEQAQRFELFTGAKSDGNIRLYERVGYKIFKREEINQDLSFVFMQKSK